MRLKPAATDNNLASQVLQVLFNYGNNLQLGTGPSHCYISVLDVSSLDKSNHLSSGSLSLAGPATTIVTATHLWIFVSGWLYYIKATSGPVHITLLKTIMHLTQYESTIMMLYYFMQTTCFKSSSFHNLFSVNIHSGFGTLEQY